MGATAHVGPALVPVPVAELICNERDLTAMCLPFNVSYSRTSNTTGRLARTRGGLTFLGIQNLFCFFVRSLACMLLGCVRWPGPLLVRLGAYCAFEPNHKTASPRFMLYTFTHWWGLSRLRNNHQNSPSQDVLDILGSFWPHVPLPNMNLLVRLRFCFCARFVTPC